MPAALRACLDALGLKRAPFPTTPDAACYFQPPWLQQEMVETLHCVSAHKGFVLITGEIGLGKSTFVRHLTQSLIADNCAVAFVLNTFLPGEDLLRSINRDLGLKPGRDSAADLARLNAFLLQQHAQNRTVLIVVDDAQNLSMENLELIRMLSNIETSQEKLVQILLCGQPELGQKLAQPAIRQLASRIVKHVQLRPLHASEVHEYIGFRLAGAGADADLKMTPRALRALYRHSRGNPRRIHLILDRCLYGLVGARARTITVQLVDCAAAEAGMRVSAPLRRRSVRLALGGAAALGMATAVAAAVLWHGTPSSQAHWTGKASVASAIVPTPATVSQAAVPVPTAATDVAASNQASIHCLQSFGVHERSRHILRALHNGDVATVKLAVTTQDPALAVFALPGGPTTETLSSTACALRATAPRVLLWLPPVPLKNFALGAHGRGILQTQSDLRMLGLYHDHLDGIAGPHTIAAIAAFQLQHQLVQTGYPDVLTRFLLQRETAQAAAQLQPLES